MPRRRLGVALLLPPDVAVAVDALRHACGDRSLGRVPAHVTLVPPVNVREEHVDGALALMRAAASRIPPLELEVGPAATFHPATPVAYLEVHGDLDGLSSLRDELLHPPLARQLTWPFVPHVTLRDDAPPERLGAIVAALADARWSCRVGAVHLLEEQRDSDGQRRWRPVADASFARERRIGTGGLPLDLAVGHQPDPEVLRLLGDEPLTVTARRDGRVVGAAVGWRSDPRAARVCVAEGEELLGVREHLDAALRRLAEGQA